MIEPERHPGRHFGRSVDYLGVLGQTLRDLTGYATLAHELIQNAVDAQASWMVFDIGQDALVVDNDGVFTDCGRIEDDVCPWKDDAAKQHRCDFHRFRILAGADKRDEAGTVGAFGIGFTAVYQITDLPSLISVGRHWTINEVAEADRRITQCSGCDVCNSNDLPGTRLILPWARNNQSELRRRLRAEAVARDVTERMQNELKATLPTAMLFLDGLHKIEISRHGVTAQLLEREAVDDKIILLGGLGDRVWHLVRGNFEAVASTLKQKHPTRIEAKRSSEIAVAVPQDLVTTGVLCAYLPTQHHTGLPFHIQADFFPRSDRKGIILDAGYQAEWNAAALKAAAGAVGRAIETLKETLGPIRLWELATAVNRVAQEVKKGERELVLGEFWDSLKPALRSGQTVWTTSQTWSLPSEALLLQKTEEEVSEPVLRRLGIPLVHSDLRPFFVLLHSGDVGVRLLDVPDVIAAIRATGISASVEPGSIHPPLNDEEFLPLIWTELRHLLQRSRRAEDVPRITDAIEQCPIVPCVDGTWRSGDDTYVADQRTVRVCQDAGLKLAFAGSVRDCDDLIRRFCVELRPELLIDELEAALRSDLPIQLSREGARLLLQWFEDERSRWLSDSVLRGRLAALPLFPAGNSLLPLDELWLPGDFSDPLGLANVVTPEDLGGKRDFLREIGARELTLVEYARRDLPRAFEGDRFASEKRRDAVKLLARRLGELRADALCLSALRKVALIECTDGVWRKPNEVYAATEIVRAVLGDSVPSARIPDDNRDAIELLVEWLGVATTPRVTDVLQKLENLPLASVTGTHRSETATVLQYLASAWKAGAVDRSVIQRLKELAWLPAKGDQSRWHRPRELFETFREYLFASSAIFLDVPRDVQSAAADFLKELGVGRSPTITQVVNHLLTAARNNQPVNQEVFAFLSDELNDSHASDIARLRRESFIPNPNGGYLTARQVFWARHPFGRWRAMLSSELRRCQRLFDYAGVRETPDADDARDVLLEIASEYRKGNRLLDADTRSVVIECWRLLSQSLGQENPANQQLFALRETKVVPDSRGILERPAVLFFEDTTGLTQRFPRLKSSVIPRIEGAWRAMQAAGVRSVSQSARRELLECDNAQEDVALRDRVLSRRLEIKRVLAAGTDDSTNRLTLFDRLLDSLQFKSATRLVTRYAIEYFGKVEPSDEEEVSALYLPQETTLFRLHGQRERIWAAIARELARAIDSESESSGALASGLREVLAARTPDDATAILDELGYAPVFEEIAQAAKALEIATLGNEATTSESAFQSASSEPKVAPPSGTPNGATAAPVAHLPPAIREYPADVPPQGDNAKLDDEGLQHDGAEMAGSSESEAVARSPRPQARLRSYVSLGIHGTVSREAEIVAARTALDQAGIELVMRYERSCGRFPTEMWHTNPGFDIVSRDESGQILRYVEVKSTGEDWGERGVALSDVQFNYAREHAELFWLYVIVRPGDQDHQLYRVQNPAQQVGQYVFDRGWSVVAESDDQAPDYG
jgi:hypothetical protein